LKAAQSDQDVEALLSSEARAALPLHRQLLLYLDPFAFFKDASRGAPRDRASARAYNRAQRFLLLAYVRRWMLIAAIFFVSIAPAEALAVQVPLLMIPAAGCGIAFSIAVAIAALAAGAYLLLGTL
jgi:hypothetical protein